MSSQLDIEDEINLGSLEPVILKKRMLEILESDPWNKTSLKVLSELEFGDSSRLYRIDALKSESSDLELAREFVIWEVEEEIMGSEKKRIERLCYRIGRIIELISINNEAVVMITLGFSAFKIKSIGLKKIPPPMPIIPEINPRMEPIKIEINGLSFLSTKFLPS